MGKTAKDVMKYAISQIGVKESPAGSNKVKYNTWFYGKEVSGSAYPWCAAFVSYVFNKVGASSIFYKGIKTAYCPNIEAWGKEENLIVSKSSGQYGDIVLFDFSGSGISGHVGFIEKKNGDGTYSTIEGNTGIGNNANGGMVMRRTRNQSCIRCIIRPKYEAEKPTVVAKPTLKKSNSGKQVKNLQKNLNYVLGLNLTVDGEFGTKTAKAVKKFKKKYKLTSTTGTYGKKAYAKMKSLIG